MTKRMFPDLADAIDGLFVPAESDALAEALRLADRLQARVCDAICRFDDTNEWDIVEGCASLGAWVRIKADLTPGDAGRLVKTARRLRHLPTLRGAWLAGEIAGGHVQAVVANLSDRTAPLFAEQENDLVPLLGQIEVGAAVTCMKRWAAEAKERLGDDGSEPDPDRSAHLSPTLSGGRLDANLEPEAYHAAEAALRLAMGKKADDDERTLTQRRHDALADVFTHFLDHQRTRRGGHHRPHLNLTIPLESLQSGTGQGSFDDGAPISAEDARRLACDANIHRVITRANGSILDFGRATRSVSAALSMVLCLRDKGCRFPGCDRPCHLTDAHHIKHWVRYGKTKPENLVLLCRAHHKTVHRKGWSIELRPDTTVVVTDPDGRRRTSRPPDADALLTPAA